jgi:D-serine deaminase-like pyridoxal phosphate-dependent protein
MIGGCRPARVRDRHIREDGHVTGLAAVDRIPTPTIPDDVPTPAAVVDLSVVRANVATMQSAMNDAGVLLRPHAKTHKCVEVAQLQLEAGARGLTVGTVGEAEVFADAGVDDLFIAYPVYADGSRGNRIRDLHEWVRLAVGVDSDEGVAAIARATRGTATPLEVMIEVDSGGHRTGVAAPADVSRLARAIKDHGLRLRGVFTHGGHGYRGGDATTAAAHDEVETLTKARDELDAAGFAVDVLSAGSTPTVELSARAPVTEQRPGTYVFNDAQQVFLGAVAPTAVAFFVVATVVSNAVPGQVIIDAGAKAVSRDAHPILPGFGRLADPRLPLRTMNDYHGFVDVPEGSPSPRIGDRVIVVPNHVCPTVNLYDELVIVDEGDVVDTWRVAARGRNG